MSTCITSDFAVATKLSKDTISLKSKSQFIGTELNDERFEKLYTTYCALVLEQWNEDMDNLEETNG